MLGDNAPKTEFTFGIGWVDAACAQARKYRDGLNSLNAFPVPDKDTGSNLTVTLTALKEAFDAEYEVLQKEPKPADAAALNLRIGQLYERAIMQAYRSARGNSGTCCVPGLWKRYGATGVYRDTSPRIWTSRR